MSECSVPFGKISKWSGQAVPVGPVGPVTVPGPSPPLESEPSRCPCLGWGFFNWHSGDSYTGRDIWGLGLRGLSEVLAKLWRWASAKTGLLCEHVGVLRPLRQNIEVDRSGWSGPHA
jgi:hypothetical protein